MNRQQFILDVSVELKSLFPSLVFTEGSTLLKEIEGSERPMDPNRFIELVRHLGVEEVPASSDQQVERLSKRIRNFQYFHWEFALNTATQMLHLSSCCYVDYAVEQGTEVLLLSGKSLTAEPENMYRCDHPQGNCGRRLEIRLEKFGVKLDKKPR